MRAVCFRDLQKVSSDRIADAEIEERTDAIVETELAGLCGSDLHPFFGREKGLESGTVMGHEFVGRIVQIGDSVRELSVGDRVCSPFTTNCGTCFYCKRGLTSRCIVGELFGWRQNGIGLHGGQSELVRVPLADATLMKVPNGIDPSSALLLGDNLSTAYFGASMAVETETLSTDVLAVVGCGTVGLLSIESARSLGVNHLFAIDPNESRLRVAERLGARVFSNSREAISEVRKATDGRGADGVMEFVGLPDAQRLAYELIRPGGRMSVIGCHCTPNFSFTPAEAYDKNLVYLTGRCPARHYMAQLGEKLAERPLDLSWCVTHRFSVEDAEEAYDTFAYGKDGCIKAVVEF